MNFFNHIVLASGSPRRAELLKRAGYTFSVCVSDVDESRPLDCAPVDVAVGNARAKAHAVAAKSQPGTLIIGADTIVVLDGCIFGKPKDSADAHAMLQALSGRAHEVITGVCLVTGCKEKTFSESTRVFFRKLSDEDIDAYIASGEPFDKAGGYGIQGAAGAFVDHIEGSYKNVIGLPIEMLARHLR